MNVLLIGSGGREHALAWAISASPLLTSLLRAGQCRHRRDRRVRRRSTSTTMPRSSQFCSEQRHRLRRGRPRGAAGGRARRRPGGGRHQGLRPLQGGRPARRLEGLHQGLLRRVRHPHRRLRALHGCRVGAGLSSPAQPLPIVVKADGLAAGKGVVIAETRERGRRPPSRRASAGAFGAAGAEVVIEECPGRRGGELLRARRRHARAGARRGAGPQARRRRRHGPQHRRHGRLFAGAGHDARR